MACFPLEALAAGSANAAPPPSSSQRSADLVVYGGTVAGIAAAIQATRMGHTVILIESGPYVGGMMTGGLGASDKGVFWTVGGMAKEYFHNVYDYYQQPGVWKYETRAEYLPKHGLTATEAVKCQWFFEPKVASLILGRMLDQAKIKVIVQERLDRRAGVTKEGAAIRRIRMESGLTVSGKYFIDATYEGDLMAAAGVKYIVGRESNAQYGETVNGVHALSPHRTAKISPYVTPGDPKSGLLPRVEARSPGEDGTGDHRPQAYNFRLCLTNVPENRVPFVKPAGYNPLQYEMILRNLLNKKVHEPGKGFFTRVPMPNLKTDSNNNGLFSTDYIGGNFGWAEASYAEREKLLAENRAFLAGYLWMLSNDPRVPESVRQDVGSLGYAKDEFTANGNFPTQLYVREARRMIGEYVMSEKDFSIKGRGEQKGMVLSTPEKPITDGVAVGSYALDSHFVSFYADEATGALRAEGTFYLGVLPYPISYRILLPKAEQCINLLVPVAISATHVAHGSMRMEPVFMELGQASGTAACLAMDLKTSLHQLPYDALRKRLLADGALLDPIKPKHVKGGEPDKPEPR